MKYCTSERTIPVSVVIATLGGEVLKRTIAQLNQGSRFPAEILICIPEAEADNAACVANISNVHIIKTQCRGQVAQRAVGLTMVRFPYVMQLDDDIIFLPETLRGMFEALLAKGTGSVIAPFFRIQSSGRDCTSYEEGLKGFLRSCYYTLICGAPFGRNRLGRIASSGIGFGVPMTTGSERIVESEWLPGGVALCCKEDLITYNYYPYPGKAYSEDLIHSILWRRNGCRLWTVLDVSAMIDVTIESFVMQSAIQRYRAHTYVANLVEGSVLRTRIWFAFYCLLNSRHFFLQNLIRQ